MTRFSLDEGTSGSKRKKCSNKTEEEEEDDELMKKSEEFTRDEEEEEDSEEEEEEMEDEEEMKETFKFSIDPDVLDCSICFLPLCPPIFQCKNGHIACSCCCPKLSNKCHFCSQHIGRRRCIALEKVIESITIPCRYARYGCQAVVSFTKTASHEEGCAHATLFCPVTDCTFSGSKSLLFAHANCSHHNISMKFYYDNLFKIALEKQQPSMVLLGEDQRLFILLNAHDTVRGNTLSMICIASGSPEREFSYELSVDAGESSLQLTTSVEKIRMWNGVHPSKAFLVVPNYFFTSSSSSSTNAKLSVMVSICKFSHAA